MQTTVLFKEEIVKDKTIASQQVLHLSGQAEELYRLFAKDFFRKNLVIFQL